MAAAVRVTLCLLPLLAGCATGRGLEPVFALAAEAPEDMGLRLWFDGSTLVAAATGIGPHRLPAPVRATIDGVAPAGELLFVGRECGPFGDGFRVDKRYRDGSEESFRSALIAADGSVLERRHSVPLAQVPAAVLTTAMRVGRDVRRCEIRSDSAHEVGWNAIVVDGAGHTYELELGLDAALLARHRLVRSSASIATVH